MCAQALKGMHLFVHRGLKKLVIRAYRHMDMYTHSGTHSHTHTYTHAACTHTCTNAHKHTNTLTHSLTNTYMSESNRSETVYLCSLALAQG